MSNRDDELLGLLSRAAFEVSGRRLDELGLDTHLDNFGLDSVGVLEIVGYVEDKLDLRLPDHGIVRLATMRDMVTLVERTRLAAEADG
ncbi:MAG: acyl carrier protein [Minicystis sp.]